MLALIARANAAPAPDWLTALLEEQAPVIAGAMELSRVPFLEVSFDPSAAPEGVRVIDADAGDTQVRLRYEGSWAAETPAARRDVIRNLTHELAHVWQRQLGPPTEDRLFHEGIAEAIAIATLTSCGAPCGAEGRSLLLERERACAAALASGPLISNSSVEAVYGCGAILVLAVAASAGCSPSDLYRAFVDGGRSVDGFLAFAEQSAGRAHALAARAFLFGNHSLAKPLSVIASLRAGRL
ncbi:MAG: hypothetical protein AAGH41_06580 [Pseudomonadota bacterium]